VAGPLKTIVDTTGIADIIELEQIPFGNNFYTTTECGGAPYSVTKRHCWAGKCIGDSPAADCFTGAIVSQHGDVEIGVNRMQACAKSQSTTWQEYWPFLYCMESSYDTKGIDAAEGCTKGTKIDYTKLQACYSGKDGDAAQMREAKKTIDHPGAPDITINGVHYSPPGYPFGTYTAHFLIQRVCWAYTGPKPAACTFMDSISFDLPPGQDSMTVTV